MGEKSKEVKNFRDLGVCEQLVEACEIRGWLVPSKIQSEAIPHALEGRDVIGLAETGSGKTGAFALPIIQALLEKPQPFFACVLSPTRELALQISDEFKALGSGIGLKCSVLFGGVDMMEQTISLGKRPHVVVATPGRLLDHLSNTKGFSLRMLKYLVLDEADRLLSMEFEKVIDDILKALPGDRRTFLFSATMTKKVGKLQRACLKNPVKVEASAKYSTVDTCEQKFRLVPAKYEVLVEAVKFIQKQGMKGVKGGWTEFLDSHDKQFGSCLSDPRKRSVDVLVAFLETFTQGKDRMLITKILTRHNDHEAIKQFIKEFPDQETLQQRLVKMTVEHSKYTQNYSFPSHEEDWLVLPLGKISNAMKSKKAIAVDCEMVLCEDGTDGVVRVCAVNQDLEVKLDKVVNPNKAIVDYRTEFTGITAKDLEGVTYSLDDVQKSLKKLLSNGTILVGHSLHNDLKVLKIDYPRVIDTSYIFNIKDVPTSYTPSLNNLCKSILGYEIRKEGEPHNCLVDSQAAMKLLLAKMEHGYDEPITIARKTVQNTDLPKLLLHKVPVEVPCQTLHIAFPTQYTVEIQDPKIRGQSYSTFAVFKDAREADTAYTDIDGKESTDSMGRPQKQVTLNLNTGQTVSFFVRRMISVSVLNRESKKRSAIDDGIEDSKRQKMCLQECEHVKEIERLKQEIRNREGEVFNLQKILAALTRKHGL